MKQYFLALMTLLLGACGVLSTPVAAPTATRVMPTPTQVSPTPPPTQTLEPFEEDTIDYLRQRPYGGGRIEVLEKLHETDFFTSYAIRYPSDGLTIYGFVNIPKGAGPFPVIVSVHGYAPPGTYDVFYIHADFADIFAENQFVVIHPGLCNHPPSDPGDDLLRVGMTADVMNLVALLKARGDLPAELAAANPDVMGLWGTSLGGEIALRLLTLSPDFRAAVLYSTLSGNIERNSRQMYETSGDEQFQLDYQVPLELMDRISPMYYYHRILTPVQIHHGLDDTTVPVSWAVETCDFLQAAGVSVQCIYYPGVGHVFNRSNFETLQVRALEFYRLHLSQ